MKLCEGYTMVMKYMKYTVDYLYAVISEIIQWTMKYSKYNDVLQSNTNICKKYSYGPVMTILSERSDYVLKLHDERSCNDKNVQYGKYCRDGLVMTKMK